MSSRKRILVVDDSEGVREAVAAILGNSYEVALASSAIEAKARLEEFHFGLVITDLEMYGRKNEGLEVIRAAKIDTPPVRVLLMSGNLTDVNKRLAVAAGCDGFIEKPFDLQKFRSLVREALAEPDCSVKEESLMG